MYALSSASAKKYVRLDRYSRYRCIYTYIELYRGVSTGLPYTYIYIYLYIHMDVYIYIHTRTSLYTHIHTCIYTHICIYIY